MNIGSVIMKKRKKLGYTQSDLANKLNVSFQAVSKWEKVKEHTNHGGLNVLNVFVDKPFVKSSYDSEEKEKSRFRWKSGELYMYYHDWLFHSTEEIVFDCTSGGKLHQHCMDIMIAEKVINTRKEE